MSYSIEELEIGQNATFAKTISESDVYIFAGVTGDMNPAHINSEYSKGSVFSERVVHGMLSASLISTVLGTELPGRGTIYLQQEVKFVAPVHFGDTITATVEVKEKNMKRNRVKLRTVCTNQNGLIVVDGEALVIPPKNTKKGL